MYRKNDLNKTYIKDDKNPTYVLSIFLIKIKGVINKIISKSGFKFSNTVINDKNTYIIGMYTSILLLLLQQLLKLSIKVLKTCFVF